jgi:uncharacterized membrane protein
MNTPQETQEKKTTSPRFIELDILRGFAILFMIILHLMWDLDYFGILSLDGHIYSFNIIVPTMFFLLVGICQAVNTNKYKNQPKKLYARTIQRGLWVLNLGMLFTLLTAVFLPDRPILFGVLHCIGLSLIISIFFLKMKTTTNIIIASGIILSGIIVGSLYQITQPNILQFSLGLHQANVMEHTIDYFPLLPWLGVCILGIALGNILYKDNKRRFPFPDLSKYAPSKLFSWLGKHSLAIYLLHQPIIAGILFLCIKL